METTQKLDDLVLNLAIGLQNYPETSREDVLGLVQQLDAAIPEWQKQNYKNNVTSSPH